MRAPGLVGDASAFPDAVQRVSLHPFLRAATPLRSPSSLMTRACGSYARPRGWEFLGFARLQTHATKEDTVFKAPHTRDPTLSAPHTTCGALRSARHTRSGVCRCYGPLTSLAHLSHGRVSQRGPLAKSYRREVYFLYLAFWASESLPQAAPSALPTSPNAIFGFFLTMPGRSCLQKSM